MARPARPMRPGMQPDGRPDRRPGPLDASALDRAFEDLAEGVLSFEGATAFTSLCEDELRAAVASGEIEVFRYKRRVLLVKTSVQKWLARMLAAEREQKRLASLVRQSS